MKKWIVRFVSLWAFNILVLLLIGLILPSVNVGFAAIWGGVILTAATIWLKPLITRVFAGATAKSASQRTKAGEKLVQYGSVFIVAAIIWVLTVWLTSVNVRGFFWGYVLPPVILLIAWAIYDAIDDRIEGHAARLYDRATSRRADASAPVTSAGAPPIPSSPAAAEAARELNDGLTAEQRRMLDELGKS